MYDKGKFFKATFQPGIKPEYNIFLSPDKLSDRNDVTLGKANVRPDIRQNFLKKIRTSRLCVALKTIWSYFTFMNIKLK